MRLNEFKFENDFSTVFLRYSTVMTTVIYFGFIPINKLIFSEFSLNSFSFN